MVLSDNGTAFAVWQHHVPVAKKILKVYSIHTAELSTILKAVDVAGHSERHRHSGRSLYTAVHRAQYKELSNIIIGTLCFQKLMMNMRK